jgi:hypothetical protein
MSDHLAPARPRSQSADPRPSRKLAAGCWAGAVMITVIPLGVLFAINPLGLSLREVIAAAAASAGPALYFGLTARWCAGPTVPQKALTLLSKFSATLIVAGSLGIIAEVGALGLIIAVVGICAASIIGVGTLLLSRGQLLGVLPVVLILLSGGVICLRQRYEDSFTTYDVWAVGALAIAIACAAIVLNGAILCGRRGTGARPGAMGRGRSSVPLDS